MIRTEPDGARSDSLSSSPTNNATVAELGDAQDLGSCGATRGGSSPSGRIAACEDVAHPGPWHPSPRPITSPPTTVPKVSRCAALLKLPPPSCSPLPPPPPPRR